MNFLKADMHICVPTYLQAITKFYFHWVKVHIKVSLKLNYIEKKTNNLGRLQIQIVNIISIKASIASVE